MKSKQRNWLKTGVILLLLFNFFYLQGLINMFIRVGFTDSEFVFKIDFLILGISTLLTFPSLIFYFKTRKISEINLDSRIIDDSLLSRRKTNFSFITLLNKLYGISLILISLNKIYHFYKYESFFSITIFLVCSLVLCLFAYTIIKDSNRIN